jgi:predicted transcriptional regulator of viral defense system
MQTTGWRLGPQESKLFAWTQLRGLERVRREDVAQSLRLTETQTTHLLSRMKRRGLLVQLQRGLYLVPRTLPPGGKWMPSAAVVIRHLMEALGGQWQMAGPVAFHHYGLTEQVPNITAVYNDRLSGRKKIGSLEVTFIKVSAKRLGALATGDQKTPENMPTLARTIMDGVYDYSRFGSLPAAFGWIAERKGNSDLFLDLAKTAKKFGNVATCRRIGYCLKELGAPERMTELLRKNLRDTESVIPLLPALSRKGKIDSVWGIIQNTPFPPNE